MDLGGQKSQNTTKKLARPNGGGDMVDAFTTFKVNPKNTLHRNQI